MIYILITPDMCLGHHKHISGVNKICKDPCGVLNSPDTHNNNDDDDDDDDNNWFVMPSIQDNVLEHILMTVHVKEHYLIDTLKIDRYIICM